MSVLDEVTRRKRGVQPHVRRQERARAPTRTALRDPHLHGRPPRPRQVRRPERRRRPRDPQRRRPRKRRRDPLTRDLLQAPRHRRMVRDPPLRLRHGVLQQRPHGATCSPRASRPPRSDRTASTTSAPGPGSTAGRDIDWLTISDREQSVVDDVRRIRNHPLVPPTIPIYGYVYNVRTGGLEEVTAATEAGRVTVTAAA